MNEEFTSDWIGTFSGKQININEICDSDIEIVDVAVGLAQQCRYAGQVWPFYSVAEHSILVSMLVEDEPQLRLKALLHDAPEYILNDLIRPVKRKISGYDALEDVVHAALSKKFDLVYNEDDWLKIKMVDDLITVAERRKLMPRLDPGAYGRGVPEVEIPLVHFECMSPPVAALQFLSRFRFLSGLPLDGDGQADLVDVIAGAR